MLAAVWGVACQDDSHPAEGNLGDAGGEMDAIIDVAMRRLVRRNEFRAAGWPTIWLEITNV